MTLQENYATLRDGIALVTRDDRALLEVRGRDRLTWLHSFVTNAVKHLGHGDGTYAFALNTQGRILFDMNILVGDEYVWLDVAKIFFGVATKHLNKYVITEDVTLVDRSNQFARFGIAGQRSGDFFASLGVTQFTTMPSLGTVSVSWHDRPITVLRNDFCGPLGGEVWVPSELGKTFRSEMTDASRSNRAAPVGDDAVLVHRIEAGIPWPGREITDEYLPAETKQLTRAVNFNKGCYLGQEVVERMRSRNVVARQLVGLTIDGSAPPIAGAALLAADEKPVGVITSVCHSVALDRVIALGYLKSASADEGSQVSIKTEDGSRGAQVVGLPFVGSMKH